MYPVTQDFLDKMKADRRQVLARAVIDYTDPFIDQSIEIEASEQANVSYPQQTADSVDTAIHKWASLDGSWVLDGTYHLAPGPDKLMQYQFGWWGKQLAGAEGGFTSPYPALTVTHLPRPIHTLKVIGDTARGEYPVDFEIKLYAQDDTLLYTETVTGNTLVSWSKTLPSPVLDVAKQVLTITRWSHEGRQAKIIEFFTSIREVYETGDLMSLHLLEEREASQGSLPVGNISANELTLTLNNENKKFDVDNEQSPLKNLLKPNRRIQVWLGVEVERKKEEYSKDCTGGRVYFASGTAWGSDPEMAFDDNEDTFWDSGGAAFPKYFGVDFQNDPKQIRRLRIKPRDGRLKDFIFQGSNDGHTWLDIHTDTATNSSEWQTFTFENNNSYRYYRVYGLNNHIGTNYMVIYECEMMELTIETYIEKEYVPLGTFWSLDWDSPDDTLEATVTARDRMELLRKSTFQTSQVLQNKSLYELAEIVLQDAGLMPDEYIIDTALHNIVVPYSWFNPVSHREALRLIAEAGLAAAFQNRDGKIQIESFLISGDEPVLEITEDDYFPPLSAPSRQDQVANEIIVDTQPLRPATTSEEVYRSNEPITIPGNSTKTVTAFYNQPPVIEAAASLDSPAAGVSIVDATYYGWGASVKIQNTNATDKQVTLVIQGKPLTVQNKERAIARDEASITENGVLRYEFPANPLVQTLAQAQAIADTLLASVKDARRDIEVEWRGNPALLLGDRVTVKNQDYHIIRQEIEWAGALSARLTGRKVGS